jgi:hypothetical protein
MKISITKWLWAMVIPHVSLVLIQAWDASLIWSQLSSNSQHNWLWLFFSYAMLLLWDGCLFKAVWQQKKDLEFSGLSFLTHLASAILIIFLNPTTEGIPRWIYDPQDTYIYHYTFLMPGLVMWTHALAEQHNSSTQHHWKRALAMLVGIPLFWLAFINLMGMLPRAYRSITSIFSIALSIVSPILLVYACFTLVMALVSRNNSITLTKRLMMPIISLVLPLGGMWLNKSTPFPIDLQNQWIYAWIILNACTMLPIQNHNYRLWSYPIGVVSFSMSTYFFLVFLPYLPFFVIAIIAMGLGFLLLSPIALWAYQQKDLAEKKLLWDERCGRRWSMVMSGLLVALLPGLMILQSVRMRIHLNTALQQVFEPWSPVKKQLSPQTRKQSAEALVLLRDIKEGIHYPYLYLLHRSIVFGGMVLSNEKLEQAYTTLTGLALPPFKSTHLFGGHRSTPWRGNTIKPSFDAKLLRLDCERDQEIMGQRETVLKGTVDNITVNNHCEWNADILCPKGVLLTAVQLKINETWVDADLRDKKTALWIFDKIQEVRRDPIIAYYENEDQIKVRIYPVPAKAQREFRLVFTYPEGFALETKAEGRKIELQLKADSKSLFLGNELVWVPPEFNLSEVSIEPKPYIHFILEERSLDTSLNAQKKFREQLFTRMESIATQLNLQEAKISLAGDSLQSIINSPELLQEWPKSKAFMAMSVSPSPVAIDHVVQEALFRHQPKSEKEWQAYRPEKIVILSQQPKLNFTTELSLWHKYSPDYDGFSIAKGTRLHHYTFKNPTVETGAPSVLQTCRWFRSGEVLFSLPIHQSGLFLTRSKFVEQYHDGSWTTCLTKTLSATLNDDYTLWMESFHPWEHRTPMDLLKDSKTSQILIRSTAFIAVETETQNNLLVRKEQQAMLNHEALDFEEVKATAPDDLLWIILLLACGLWWKKLRYE